VFPDELFEDLFPSRRGKPSVPGDVIASVMVLQALGACLTVKLCGVWRPMSTERPATGLTLSDEVFNPRVLVLWRNKLRAWKRPQRLFDAIRRW
jgi:hypothetical protein